jgi:hypothetical protein
MPWHLPRQSKQPSSRRSWGGSQEEPEAAQVREHGAGAATGAGQQQPQACWTGAGAATTAGAGAAQLPTGAARATCT